MAAVPAGVVFVIPARVSADPESRSGNFWIPGSTVRVAPE